LLFARSNLTIKLGDCFVGLRPPRNDTMQHINKNGREIKSVFIFNFMTFVTTIKNHFGRTITPSLETEWRVRTRQARYPKFDAHSN